MRRDTRTPEEVWRDIEAEVDRKRRRERVREAAPYLLFATALVIAGVALPFII